MDFPITLNKLQQMTDLAQRLRGEDLRRIVHSDIQPPAYILQQLERDVTESIYKKEKRTRFSYELNRYYRIYGMFAKADADAAILEMANGYVCDYFPTATVAIESADGISCMVVLNFTLPWLSGQMNSHPRLE
jgi:hypothetical protein